MTVREDHSELVPHSHTSNHIADSTLNATNRRVSFLALQPNLELEDGLARFSRFLLVNLNRSVLEGLGESAQGALDGNGP